jgi:hypothetical protein
MNISAKIIRLTLLSVVLGIAFLGSAQPASAFSLNPIKIVKSAAKAVVSTATTVVKAAGTVVSTAVKAEGTVLKATVKAAGIAVKLTGAIYSQAFKMSSQIALATGKGLLTGGNFLGSGILKIATAKDPLKAMAQVAVLGTPLAPFAVAKQTFDSLKSPPRMKDFIPAPPTLAGLNRAPTIAGLSRGPIITGLGKGISTVKLAGPTSVFAPKSAGIGRALGEPKRIEEAKRITGEPKRLEEQKRITGEPKRLEEPKRIVGEPKRIGEPKRMEESKRMMAEPKRMEEQKRMMEAPKRMEAPKPVMTPTSPMISGYGASVGVRR